MSDNNRMSDDSDFWKMVRKKSSHDLDDNGNKIPPVRPLEELMELVLDNPKSITTFTKQEKEIFKAEMDRQQEEFKRMPYEVQKEILDKTYEMIENDPDISDSDKADIKKMNDEFLKALNKNRTPNEDSMFNLGEDFYGVDSFADEDEIIEPVNVDSLLSEVYGEEVQVLREYKKSDYSVEVDDVFVKFHVKGEVPPRTKLVFKDTIDKLQLTYHDNGFWKFHSTAAELKYWLKEYNLI